MGPLRGPMALLGIRYANREARRPAVIDWGLGTRPRIAIRSVTVDQRRAGAKQRTLAPSDP